MAALIAPFALLAETAFCAVLAAALLDACVRRPVTGGGSITTLLPGFVYACATLMKVCLVGGLLSAAAWRWWPIWRWSAPWGTVSAAIPPVTPLLGTLAVLGLQQQFSDLAPVSRWAVLAMMAALAAGGLAGAVSLTRRQEQPRSPAVWGLTMALSLLALFWRLRFYAAGFDQDAWAPLP
ncbi:MAG: hypothetical protein IT162_11915 [Bryobacterales bacterium]|nr:hypothetical protein [Bryobacterales bacterium]